MAIIGYALRQAFMPKHEYQNLCDEDKAWIKLQKPIFIFIFTFIILLILISNAITLKIMFPRDPESRPFCKHLSIKTSTVNEDQEIVDYYWLILFVPSVILFFLSAVYLVAVMIVAYNAPTRHGCLKVVENNYCAPNPEGGQIIDVEMLEVNPVELTPDMERRIHEGFKSWMRSSYLESDHEDDPGEYQEIYPQI